MEIHRFERVWLIASLLLILTFIGTIVYGAAGAGVSMIGDEGGQVASPTDPTASESFRDPGVYQAEDGSYHAYVIARQFLFDPGTSKPLRLPAGEPVTFHVTSADVVHGYQVVGTNVNMMVIPGQVSQVTVRFDEPGTYRIVCNEYCGSGHHAMEGTIEVVPQSEFATNATQGAN